MPINRSIFLAQTIALILAAPFCINAQEKSHVTSEQVTHAVQELEKLAQKQIQENVVPGIAIAVVFQDKAVYAKGFGVRDVNTKQPIDADTVFQLASVSKSIGSTVVAELVGEGKITWDSKLSALDPAFAMFDPWVTARNYNSRHVRAPQQLARARGRSARRSGVYAHGNFTSSAFSTSRKQLSFALRLYEFWYDRGRRRGGESVRAGMGGGVRTKTIPSPRHDFDEFALSGFCRTPEQGVGACAGGWQMGTKV